MLRLEFEYNVLHRTEHLLSMHHDTGEMSSYFRSTDERNEIAIAKPVRATLRSMLQAYFDQHNRDGGSATLRDANITHGDLQLNDACVFVHNKTFGLKRVIVQFEEVSGDLQTIFCDVPALSTANKVAMLFKSLSGLTDFGRYLLESNWHNIEQAQSRNDTSNVVLFKERDTELRFFLDMVLRQIEQVDALAELEPDKPSGTNAAPLDELKPTNDLRRIL